MFHKKYMKKRIVMALAGTVLTGICVGGMQKAGLGVDPFTCLVTAFSIIFGTTYSICFFILTGIFLTGAFLIERRLVGIATVFNLLLCGTSAGITKNFLDLYIKTDSMAVRFILLIVSLIVVCFAGSLYFTADVGVSAYDAVALIVSERKSILPFKAWRILSDILCCLIGIVCGVKIGIGTVITAFMMGPFLQWFNEHVSEKILYGREK